MAESSYVKVPNSWPLGYSLPSDVKKIALLMIDFQGDFCCNSESFIAAMGGPKDLKTASVLPAAKNLLQAARQAGIHIIHTLEAHRPDLSDLSPSKDMRSRHLEKPNEAVIGADGGNGRMLTRGSPCNGLLPEVAFVDGEVAIHKPGKGAFCDTELRARLDGVSHVIFAGVTTECCVQTTMREANDRGFYCLVAEDATASVVPEFHDQAIRLITSFGSIIGSAAKVVDIVNSLSDLAASPPSSSVGMGMSMEPSSSTTFPVIDVAPLVKKLNKPFSAARNAVDAECLFVASKIDQACRESGFFYVVGHGLAPPFETAKELFDLDMESKMALRAKAGEGAGYEPSGAQVLDEGRLGDGIDGMVHFGDRKESYIVGKSAPSQRLGSSSGVEGQWPAESKPGNTHVGEGFRDKMTKYHDSCEQFLRIILRGCALGLGLAADTFDCFTTDAMTKLRLLRYPSPTSDSTYSQGAQGCGAHQDWGALTLLAQDDVGGLEVFSGGEWNSVPHHPGSLLVNVGDMMNMWTSCRYRSAPHRVLVPNRQRHSIAFFYNCDSDAPIDPRFLMPNMKTESSKRKPGETFLTAEAYILERVNGTYSIEQVFD